MLDVRQLNKIIKLHYFHILKALWDSQGKVIMYYGKPRVKKQLSGKRSITKKSSPYIVVQTTNVSASFINGQFNSRH